MISGTFEYFAPTSVEEAASLLSKHKGEAKILAGGHSLLPMMKLRLAEPKYLVDLGKVKELTYIKDARDGLAIGAMTTYYQLESSDVVKAKAPLLAQAAGQVADVQVRNMGTIGGSLSHADPAGDLPAVALALGAQITARTRRGSRTIGIDRFFVDMLTTALKPNEIVTEIKVPAFPARTGTFYQKFQNKASHYAIVGVAAVITLDTNSECTDARIAVTGAGATAVRARNTERILKGKKPDDSVIKRAAARADANIDVVMGDIHASEEYRTHLTHVLAERAIKEAVARAK